MCWAIITAGASAGSRVSSSRVASVPPVEAPMKTIYSFESRPSGMGGVGAAGPADAAADGSLCTRASAAALSAAATGPTIAA
jgi:hypothetical protein